MEKGCPVVAIFGMLSKRWMLLILRSLNEGKETFGDIKRALSGVSARILSERLAELQSEGYVERKVLEERPVKIRYSVTEKGKSLGGCIHELDSWAREHA